MLRKALFCILFISLTSRAEKEVFFFNAVRNVLHQIDARSAEGVRSWKELARFSMVEGQMTRQDFITRSGLEPSEFDDLMQNNLHTPRVRLAVVAQFVRCSHTFLALDVLNLPETKLHIDDDPLIAEQFDRKRMHDEIKKNIEKYRSLFSTEAISRDDRKRAKTEKIEALQTQRLDLARRLTALLDAGGISFDFLEWKLEYPKNVFAHFQKEASFAASFALEKDEVKHKILAALTDLLSDVRLEAPLEAKIVEEYRLWGQGKHPLQLQEAQEKFNAQVLRQEQAEQTRILTLLKQAGFSTDEILDLAGIEKTSSNRARTSFIMTGQAGTPGQFFAPDQRKRLRDLLNEPGDQLNYPAGIKHKHGLQMTNQQIRDKALVADAVRMLGELAAAKVPLSEVAQALPQTAQTTSLFFVDWMEYASALPTCIRFLSKPDRYQAARWTSEDHMALLRLYKKKFP